MRDVEINGQVFSVRGFKRKEVRKLKKYGLGSMRFDVKPDLFDALVDEAFGMVFTKDQVSEIEELGNREAIPLFEAILAETYGSEEEEKNSSGSGLSARTRSGTGIADTAGSNTDSDPDPLLTDPWP